MALLQRHDTGLTDKEIVSLVDRAYLRAAKHRGCDMRHLAVALGYRICPVADLAATATIKGDRLDYRWSKVGLECSLHAGYGVAAALLRGTAGGESESDRQAILRELVLSRTCAKAMDVFQIVNDYRNAPRWYLERAWAEVRGSRARAKKIS